MVSPAMLRGSRSRLNLSLIALAAAAWGTLGIYCLWRALTDGAASGCYASAGILLVVACLCYAALGAAAARSHRDRQPSLVARPALRWIVVGAALAYAACLAIGPAPGMWAAMTALVSLWSGVLLLPLAATPQTLEHWRKLIEQRKPKRVGVAVYHAVLALVLAEAALRGWRWTESLAASLTGPATAQAAPAIDAAAERMLAGQLPADSAWLAGLLRVAVVDGLTSATGERGPVCVEGLDSLAGGFQTRRIHRQVAADGTVDGTWLAEIEAFGPDLVLGVVAMEEGLSPPPAARDAFDWRSLALVDLVCQALASPVPTDNSQRTATGPTAGDALACASGRLSICHTPLAPGMRDRWQETFGRLDAFVGECSSLGKNVALVVVPDGFQVNRVLCDVLRRRAGYEPVELDLALPQRRLAAYAAERQVALLDLLPYMQASQQPVYRSGDRGWSVEGRSVAGQAISGWLRAHYSGRMATAQLSGGD